MQHRSVDVELRFLYYNYFRIILGINYIFSIFFWGPPVFFFLVYFGLPLLPGKLQIFLFLVFSGACSYWEEGPFFFVFNFSRGGRRSCKFHFSLKYIKVPPEFLRLFLFQQRTILRVEGCDFDYRFEDRSYPCRMNVQFFFYEIKKVHVGFFTSEKKCMLDGHGGVKSQERTLTEHDSQSEHGPSLTPRRA